MLSRLSLSTLLAIAIPCFGGNIYDSLSQFPAQVKNYDYIVIGGGTAGNVVAHRLAQDNTSSVLIIEAGGSNTRSLNLAVPAFYPRAQNTIVDWNYSSIPQSSLDNRVLPYPRGHVLGGSSCLSGMAITRGSSDNYDYMAEITGDKGWSYERILPYIFKNEKIYSPQDQHNTSNQIISSAHGHFGLVGHSLPNYPSPLDGRVIETTKEMKDDFPYTQDMNAGSELGLGFQLSTIREGIHDNSATAYLDPKFVREHRIDVLLNTPVTRVLPEPKIPGSSGIRVKTVEAAVARNTSRMYFTAQKEIVLSAGAINTPQLLMLSGIGPTSHLSSFNITTIVDNPSVGNHFADHPGVMLSWFINETYPTTIDMDNSLKEWNKSRTGPLATTNTNMRGHFRLKQAALEELKSRFGLGDPTVGKTSGHYEFVILYNSGSKTRATFSILVTLLSPISTGSIKLNSSDPFTPPLIDPNFLASEAEMYILRQGIRAAMKFISAKAWEGYILEPTTPAQVDMISKLQSESDEEVDAVMDTFIRNNTSSQRHPMGSARMGKKGDDYSAPEGGVVDPELKVKGVEGLRVVDASVIPFIPSAHTETPVYIIAERAAGIMKGEY